MPVKLYRKGKIKERVDGTKFGQIEFAVRYADFAPTTLHSPAGLNTNHNNILLEAGIPARFVDTHPDDGSMLCQWREVSVHEGRSKYDYIVTAYYDSKINLDANDADPLLWPVRGGIRAYTEQVPVFTDRDGRPLTNAAGDYYDGMTKHKRLRAYTVTANFETIPDALFELSGTLNDGPITIHGRTFAPLTGVMTDVVMPDKPERAPIQIAPFYKLYWPITYTILIDFDTWVHVLPNRGFHEIEFSWKEKDEDGLPMGNWIRSTYQEYVTRQADDHAVRARKVRITEDNGAESASPFWLTQYGESIGTLPVEAIYQGTTTAGSGVVDITSGTFSADDVGSMIAIPGAGPERRNLITRIVDVLASNQIRVFPQPQTARIGTTIRAHGLTCKTFIIDDVRSWVGLPLPNNHQ